MVTLGLLFRDLNGLTAVSPLLSLIAFNSAFVCLENGLKYLARKEHQAYLSGISRNVYEKSICRI